MGRTRADPPGWSGTAYAEESGHHRSFDDWFLDAHSPGPDDRIVDAGCGSGEFTARLAALSPGGRVIGVDQDPSMLEAAGRHHAHNLQFVQARIQELDRVCEASWADLVVSRAVFHWLPLADYLPSYRAVWRVLRPGGWFHAESGGAGNVQRVGEVLDEVAHDLGISRGGAVFPQPGAALELLEEAGFDILPGGVTTVAQRRPFDRERLLGFLRTQAVMAYGIGGSDERLDAFLSGVTERLERLRRHDRSFDQTFVRLHVRCRRPDA